MTAPAHPPAAARAASAVSVVIPCYNLGAYLDQAVQSVLDQTFTDVEILVVDDGSTDEATRHLFVSYRRPKTRILRIENRGLAAARNLGLGEARGRYVSFLDADDRLEPTFLAKAVAALDADARLGFASPWLTAFGDAAYRWSPRSCDFPVLLSECTVCTAALQRRHAVLEAGGYDEAMPLPGYEDWDLAIGLVERGWVGTILPEYLFRYRTRAGSMAEDCTAPENHARLMRYIVTKHAETYRRHLPGVLEVTEARVRELEAQDLARADGGSSAPPASSTPTAPVAEGAARVGGAGLAAAGAGSTAPPTLSVVVACRDDRSGLRETLGSLDGRSPAATEVLVVDDASTERDTLEVLEACRTGGMRVLRTAGVGLPAALRHGLEAARGAWVLGLGAGDVLASAALRDALDDPGPAAGAAFVLGGLQNGRSGGLVWHPGAGDLPGVIGCPRLHFPVTRRERLEAVGGYDGDLPTIAEADLDLALRLASAGVAGLVLDDPLLRRRVDPRSLPHADPDEACSTARAGMGAGDPPHRLEAILAKHRGLFEARWDEAILGREDHRRRAEAALGDGGADRTAPSPPGALDWGELRRLEPVSAVWGVDRGKPVDRHYIEAFLERNRSDVRGRVLEVKDPVYTKAFGAGVEVCDIVDIAPENPFATLVRDLSADASLPPRTFDCFILTQTAHIIYDVRTVLRNAARTLRPGGVLLATLPCVSRIDYESGVDGDCWRFTPASARRLAEEAFGPGQVEVQPFGNVLTCCAFLMGLAAEEMTPDELRQNDPYFPLLLGVRAVKAPLPLPAGGDGRGKALILAYHRIDRPSRDRWGLCVSPERFAAHLRHLAARFEAVRVSELAGLLARNEPVGGLVAVTFDDGYRDNLTTALPLLRERGIPATFFIAGEEAGDGRTFWWERFDASLEAMNLADASARGLHGRLMAAEPAERRTLLAELPPGEDDVPERMSPAELVELGGDPLVEIGAHGATHRAFSSLGPEEQRHEIESNVRRLREATGGGIASFAYPFGGLFTDETPRILGDAGLTAACTIENAAVTARSDPMRLPRVQVGDWDLDEFEARLRAVLDG
jgi:glycosyltransferase involved in cell wall biosynthesis/peptidoglycan/xylan/chitin deacetylase (PgdA/CDA1 family)